MIIGEAPGAVEDQRGLPFVGPSGQLLESALDQAGFPGGHYLTNVVRCRSEGQPRPESLKACRPYLLEEIETVKPKVILALGNTAWHTFGQGPITEQSGKEVWSEKYQCWVVPALHPAAILRDPNREKAWKGDIHRFVQLVEGSLSTNPSVETLVVQRDDLDVFIDEFRYQVNRERPFAFDFETDRLEWWHRDFKALTVAFSFDGESSVVLPLAHSESPFSSDDLRRVYEALRDVVSSERVPKTAHNMLFDDLVWYRVAGYLPYTTCDSMVLAHLLDENRPKGLKWLGRALLGWPDWGVDRTNLSDTPLADVAQYNGADAAATWLLREKLLAELREQPRLLQYFRSVEMPKLRALERMMIRGVYVDYQTLRERYTESIERSVQLANQIPVENPSSTQQVAEWLYENTNLPVLKWTPAGKPSTDMETIKRLSEKAPEARNVLEYRKWKKYQTTYFEPWRLALETSLDGRYHPDYRSTAVETGRLSSSFHTTPRDAFVRSVFAAPAGRTLVQFDMKQIEARLAAWRAAGSPSSLSATSANARMLSAFTMNRDVYVETAAYILNKDGSQVTKEERQIMGKVPVLAMLYRISPKGLREYAWKQFEIDWTDREATKVWRSFYEFWPEFKWWHEREERIILSRGYAQSPIGRLRRLPAALYENRQLQIEAVNAGINAPIQSVASDITQVSMIVLDAQGYAIVGNIHDALLIELPNEDALAAVPKIKDIMEQSHKALRPLGLHLPDRLVQVDIAVGPWGTGVPLDTYESTVVD